MPESTFSPKNNPFLTFIRYTPSLLSPFFSNSCNFYLLLPFTHIPNCERSLTLPLFLRLCGSHFLPTHTAHFARRTTIVCETRSARRTTIACAVHTFYLLPFTFYLKIGAFTPSPKQISPVNTTASSHNPWSINCCNV